MRGYVLTSGNAFPITFTQDNTVNGAITLDVKNGTTSTGVKSLYVNNTNPSSTNKLNKGTYLCFYNGTNYYIDTNYAISNSRTATYAGSVSNHKLIL